PCSRLLPPPREFFICALHPPGDDDAAHDRLFHAIASSSRLSGLRLRAPALRLPCWTPIAQCPSDESARTRRSPRALIGTADGGCGNFCAYRPVSAARAVRVSRRVAPEGETGVSDDRSQADR